MPFDLDILTEFSIDAIQRFAMSHREESFYAFAIDANLLCLNSEEACAKTLREYQESWERKNRLVSVWEELAKEEAKSAIDMLKRYCSMKLIEKSQISDEAGRLKTLNELRSQEREKGNPYHVPSKIQDLRDSTGDWPYQGFAELEEGVGFDSSAYEEHYTLNSEEQKRSPYGLAMDELVARLIARKAFTPLNTVVGFRAYRAEHTY